MELFFLCLVTFTGCVGYSIHFNIPPRFIPIAALGGTLTYFTYYIMKPYDGMIACSFFGSVVSSIYAESLARLLKVPATTFLIISIIPLVPGSNLYHTMELCISGEIMDFIAAAIQTLGIAGAIALGILLVSSIFRFITIIRRKTVKRAN